MNRNIRYKVNLKFQIHYISFKRVLKTYKTYIIIKKIYLLNFFKIFHRFTHYFGIKSALVPKFLILDIRELKKLNNRFLIRVITPCRH